MSMPIMLTSPRFRWIVLCQTLLVSIACWRVFKSPAPVLRFPLWRRGAPPPYSAGVYSRQAAPEGKCGTAESMASLHVLRGC